MSLSLANVTLPEKLPCAISSRSTRHFSNENLFVSPCAFVVGLGPPLSDFMSLSSSRNVWCGSREGPRT
jgi:hypothetical protein